MLEDKFNADWAEKFQSAPGQLAGRCCDVTGELARAEVVSIRARPIGRAMPAQTVRQTLSLGVSIRARPIGRAMP